MPRPPLPGPSCGLPAGAGSLGAGFSVHRQSSRCLLFHHFDPGSYYLIPDFCIFPPKLFLRFLSPPPCPVLQSGTRLPSWCPGSEGPTPVPAQPPPEPSQACRPLRPPSLHPQPGPRPSTNQRLSCNSKSTQNTSQRNRFLRPWVRRGFLGSDDEGRSNNPHPHPRHKFINFSKFKVFCAEKESEKTTHLMGENNHGSYAW